MFESVELVTIMEQSGTATIHIVEKTYNRRILELQKHRTVKRYCMRDSPLVI